MLAADGYLLGTTANFGYMSGALKHFFDSTFLEVGGSLDRRLRRRPAGGRPSAVRAWVHGRYDTTGAVRSVESIVGRSAGGRRPTCSRCSATWRGRTREAAYDAGRYHRDC